MHNFNEKTKEYDAASGKELPVWKTPQYEVAKAKAIEIIDSGKYGISDADFWILMNKTKSGKMAYTGLIAKHNACLKINDALESKFVPSCVGLDKDGYGDSLVYSYSNDDQGIYEVGEVSKANCKNAYPYAMAYKRLYDRVVLKLSKLAYAGIYSEAESDDFKQPDVSEDGPNGDFFAKEAKKTAEKPKDEQVNVNDKNNALEALKTDLKEMLSACESKCQAIINGQDAKQIRHDLKEYAEAYTISLQDAEKDSIRAALIRLNEFIKNAG